MPICECTENSIRKREDTMFAPSGITERVDLQRLLRVQIDAIAPETLVISDESGEWEYSRLRAGSLAIDREASNTGARAFASGRCSKLDAS
jgi:hypothetical protein